jgi:hypothetical protein
VQSPRSSTLPRNSPRARIQASGNPKASASAVLDSDAISESRSASSEVELVIVEPMLPHGVLTTSPDSGSTKNSAVTAARTMTTGFSGARARSTA